MTNISIYRPASKVLTVEKKLNNPKLKAWFILPLEQATRKKFFELRLGAFSRIIAAITLKIAQCIRRQ